MTRRERLIKFIENFYSPWELRRTVFHSYGHRGLQITLDDMTDEALERFADGLRWDFWFRRKLNRQNREIARARG